MKELRLYRGVPFSIIGVSLSEILFTIANVALDLFTITSMLALGRGLSGNLFTLRDSLGACQSCDTLVAWIVVHPVPGSDTATS